MVIQKMHNFTGIESCSVKKVKFYQRHYLKYAGLLCERCDGCVMYIMIREVNFSDAGASITIVRIAFEILHMYQTSYDSDSLLE